ncbi:MAG: glycoside hydrolase family 3 C-terminal domain-containing protein [Myxococcota bacterium]
MTSRHEQLLAQMTLEEKVAMVGGESTWRTRGVARLHVPGLKVTDGPNGARGASLPGEGLTSACFPCGTALAATWDPELIQRVGAALAEEARSKGARVLLGPTVNLHRHPLGGRSFECYSEDPVLTARIAIAFIRGVQGGGVATSLKHYVCNDSEFERHTISSQVPERALHELYLYPFEGAVREAEPWTIMAAYNRIHGTYATEHRELVVELLKREWGYSGVVVSDWYATRDTLAAANGGLDLEMPGPPVHMGERLLEAVKKGEVDEATLDDKVRRLLRLTQRVGAFDEAVDPAERPERAEDRPEHRALARQVAAEAMVLLRNEAGALPLERARLRSLALIGPNAHPGEIQGGGSAQVRPHHRVSIRDAIAARCGDAIELVHEPGCTNHRTIPLLDASILTPVPAGSEGLRVEYFNASEPEGEPVTETFTRSLDLRWSRPVAPGVDAEAFSVRVCAELVAPKTGCYTFALTSAGLSRLRVAGRELVDNWTRQVRGESYYGLGSREVSGTVELEAEQRVPLQLEYSSVGAPHLRGVRLGCLLPLPGDLLERAVAAAARADAAVVVVGLNSDWETEGRDREDLELPGRQVELIERVADANPRTVVVVNAGAPIRMDWIDRVPAVLQAWYPGQECGDALADVLFGRTNPSGKLPTTFPRRLEDAPAFLSYPGECGEVTYGEGIFVGYRGYDQRAIEPLLPFGHGLSYTEFEYGAPELAATEIGADEAISVELEIRNLGERGGKEVVQLYVHDVTASLARPPQELRGFRKLELAAKASARVRFRLEPRDLAFWHPRLHGSGRDGGGWYVEPGEFEIRLGSSSRDIRQRARFRVRAG